MNRMLFQSIARKVILGIGDKEDQVLVKKWRSLKPDAERIYLETLQHFSQSLLHRLRESGSVSSSGSVGLAAVSALGQFRGEADEVFFEACNGELAQYDLRAMPDGSEGFRFRLAIAEWYGDNAPSDETLTAFLTHNEVTIDQQTLGPDGVELMLSHWTSHGSYAIKVMSSELDCVDNFDLKLNELLSECDCLEQ